MDQYLKIYRKLNFPSGNIRISITDACNMKCTYCHNEGQDKCGNKYMSLDDIKFIILSSMNYGLKKIRITGGEPLIHPKIISILKMIKYDLNIENVGINTNGMKSEILYDICKEKLVNQIVVGMDYYDGIVSKQSPIGKSSGEIRSLINNICELKNGISINIDYVYHDDLQDLLLMVSWCLKHSIQLRILEKIDINNRMYSPSKFDEIYENVRSAFDLKEGITVDLNERFLFNENGSHIFFYQSHCNRSECFICKNIHIRITVDGEVKPCFFNSDCRFPLLDGDFELNMNRAIINLGKPPYSNLL